MLGCEIEIVGSARDIEVSIGIEAVDEGASLVAEIAFHLEVGIEAVGDGVFVLKFATEFTV